MNADDDAPSDPSDTNDPPPDGTAPSSALILTMAKNDRNLQLLRELLADRGYEPMTVSSLSNLEAALSSDSTADLAVIDVDGLSGDVWAYCDELSQRNVPVLAMTGTRPEATRTEGRRHGVRAVLEKPIGPDELTAAIESLVGR